MLAFHGKASIKKEYLSRLAAHEAADQIIKGTYWENGKGCAVGCTIHSGQHSAYETELGIPRVLARLEDRIFEGLPNEEAKLFPRRFLTAIKPGADLAPVFKKFLFWLLVDKNFGVIRHAKTDRTKAAIKAVAVLLQRDIKGGKVTPEEWQKARSTAYAAYAADAADAADADAAYAAAAYAYAAAYAAAAYAADADARKKSFHNQAEKLISLLKAAK